MSRATEVLKAALAQTENDRGALLKRMADLQAELDRLDADKADVETAIEKVAVRAEAEAIK